MCHWSNFGVGKDRARFKHRIELYRGWEGWGWVWEQDGTPLSIVVRICGPKAPWLLSKPYPSCLDQLWQNDDRDDTISTGGDIKFIGTFEIIALTSPVPSLMWTARQFTSRWHLWSAIEWKRGGLRNALWYILRQCVCCFAHLITLLSQPNIIACRKLGLPHWSEFSCGRIPWILQFQASLRMLAVSDFGEFSHLTWRCEFIQGYTI